MAWRLGGGVMKLVKLANLFPSEEKDNEAAHGRNQ